VLFTPSDAGFLLLDETLKLLATNKEAEQILIYPSQPDKIRQLPILLSDKVRSHLVSRKSSGAMEFSREYTSGRRRYVCRVYRLLCHDGSGGAPAYALLLERHSSGMTVLGAVAQQFALTEREMETVRLLVQGLTSKEIAARMNISPNTVKAFLRLVMVKMGVSTRSGIAGRIFGSNG
jgi:DNA-binding CsgD family transcriptional regulator